MDEMKYLCCMRVRLCTSKIEQIWDFVEFEISTYGIWQQPMQILINCVVRFHRVCMLSIAT